MSEYSGGWFPGRSNESYRENFDKIKWDPEGKVAKKGKAKESKTSLLLHVDELVKAARTPMNQRTDKTFRHVD